MLFLLACLHRGATEGIDCKAADPRVLKLYSTIAYKAIYIYYAAQPCGGALQGLPSYLLSPFLGNQCPSSSSRLFHKFDRAQPKAITTVVVLRTSWCTHAIVKALLIVELGPYTVLNLASSLDLRTLDAEFGKTWLVCSLV
jgi:hypothetical protein